MNEPKEQLPQLLEKLDEDYENLKRDPSLHLSWSSSDANTQIQVYLRNVSSTNELNEAKIQLLGKSGRLSLYLSGLREIPADIRPKIAAPVNEVKSANLEIIEERAKILYGAELDAQIAKETIDVTLPLREAPAEAGRIHPLSQVFEEVNTIFADMGFAIAEGPDIETDDYNFTKLNFPEGHPAREMHDTFFFNPKEDGSRMLLRTHTSPVQVRTMLTQKPPIRVICPGRTYRIDSDATHTPQFHQVEGLVIDKGSHLGHLKWILQEFCKAFFEVDHINMRFRPSFFPFTEPSLEVDIQCRRDKGEIRFGEGEDWLEILGCGMVHPNVLRACGIDPDVYQGFAWGMGIDRIAMLKYGISDLRQLFENDVRWLAHYGFKPLDVPTLAGGLST
jgi:phenylalanyl-tRNA synthetase alpha chain